jgi:prepilin-type N-terminal cleavage/methylation domain-containing protein/prepilin-type processing-associated H-X9-DG protein
MGNLTYLTYRKTGQRRHPRRRATQGFSLPELLVVIGIIALLLALLMPALSAAREQGKRAKCAANLMQIGLAAQMHVNEHRGYLPTAGWQWDAVGDVADPAGLEDAGEHRYDYYLDEGTKRPLPVTAALGHYLGAEVRGDSRAHVEQDLQAEALREHFRCPSQAEERWGVTQRGDGPDGSWVAPLECSSYAFNEALLGRCEDPPERRRSRGLLAEARSPSHLLLAMDGRPRTSVNRFLLVFNVAGHDTLYDFSVQTVSPAGELFDYGRHGMSANVLFADGHVELVGLGPGPMKQVGVSPAAAW